MLAGKGYISYELVHYPIQHVAIIQDNIVTIGKKKTKDIVQSYKLVQLPLLSRNRLGAINLFQLSVSRLKDDEFWYICYTY